MIRVCRATLVLLDVSVAHRFCEAQLLPDLIRYLRDPGCATPEVLSELQHSARGQRYAGLRLLEHTGWPKVSGALPPELRREYWDLKRAAQQPGDPPEKHIGEITTVLMAAHLHADLVIVDDRFGKALARRKGLARLSTAQLALEMVCDEHLTEEEGFTVFDRATEEGIGRERYSQALSEWRVRRDLER
jgi:hypothetical protein